MENEMLNVPLAKIATNEEIGVYKVRKTFNQKHIDELADDIRRNGIIEPVILARAKDGDGFSVVCGYNRIAASRKLGLEAVPAILKNLDEKERVSMSFRENLLRDDLKPKEVRDGLNFQWNSGWYKTQKDLAIAVGKGEAWVSQYLGDVKVLHENKDKLDPRAENLPPAVLNPIRAAEPEVFVKIANELAKGELPRDQKVIAERRKEVERGFEVDDKDQKVLNQPSAGYKWAAQVKDTSDEMIRLTDKNFLELHSHRRDEVVPKLAELRDYLKQILEQPIPAE